MKRDTSYTERVRFLAETAKYPSKKSLNETSLSMTNGLMLDREQRNQLLFEKFTDKFNIPAFHANMILGNKYRRKRKLRGLKLKIKCINLIKQKMKGYIKRKNMLLHQRQEKIKEVYFLESQDMQSLRSS